MERMRTKTLFSLNLLSFEYDLFLGETAALVVILGILKKESGLHWH